MPENIKAKVQDQFGKTAAAYVGSPLHARSADLQWLLEVAQPRPDQVALDVATGGGHTALALAPHVARVVATDLTPEMLAAAREFHLSQGVTNVEYVPADAEALPFADASFDLVTCRIALHHFPDPVRAVQEMARVLKPGGKALLIDNHVPEDDAADTFINTLEKLRDPSHFRAHRLSELQAFFRQAGLAPTVVKTYPTRVNFAAWTERSATPADVTARCRAMLESAPAAIRTAFAVQDEPLSFALHKVLLLGTKE
jgi:ubiquinone/menaquinone biosynthesis C-methylase UbiE